MFFFGHKSGKYESDYSEFRASFNVTGFATVMCVGILTRNTGIPLTHPPPDRIYPLELFAFKASVSRELYSLMQSVHVLRACTEFIGGPVKIIAKLLKNQNNLGTFMYKFTQYH